MPRCPVCGRWFRSRRGLSQHIAKSRDPMHILERETRRLRELGAL